MHFAGRLLAAGHVGADVCWCIGTCQLFGNHKVLFATSPAGHCAPLKLRSMNQIRYSRSEVELAN